jgi:hypothetical protein
MLHLRFGWFASSVGSFFSVASPSPSPGDPGHLIFSAWAGNWSTIPTLSIDGWDVSLAGLVMPLLISMLLLRGRSVADLPRSAIAALAASLLCNVLLVCQQAAIGFPGGGVHLCTLIPALLLLDAVRVVWLRRKPEYIDSPRNLRMLSGLSLVSLLPADAFGSMLMSRQSGTGALHGLQWVGGAGWHDGLLSCVVLVSGGCFVVWLAHRLTACAPPASSPA